MGVKRSVAVVIAVVLGVPGTAHAQFPNGAAQLSDAAVRESLAVLHELDRVIQRDARNARAWHQRGRVAWALSVRAETKPAPRGLNVVAMRSLADSSLRFAAEIGRDSIRYQLDAGIYLRYTPHSTSRFAAEKYLEAATRLADSSSDRVVRAAAFLEVGRFYWLRFDSEQNQIVSGVFCRVPPSIDSASTVRPQPGTDEFSYFVSTEIALKWIHNVLADCQSGQKDRGSGDLERAELSFREAYKSTPNDPRVFRHLAMLLADRARWRELASIARDRIPPHTRSGRQGQRTESTNDVIHNHREIVR